MTPSFMQKPAQTVAGLVNVKGPYAQQDCRKQLGKLSLVALLANGLLVMVPDALQGLHRHRQKHSKRQQVVQASRQGQAAGPQDA